MNFLGVGTGELIVVLIIAALVVGPERMVVLAGRFGRWLVKARRMLDEATAEFRDATQEVRDAFSLETGEGEAKAALPAGETPAGSVPTAAASAPLLAMASDPPPAPVVEVPQLAPEAVAAYQAQQLARQLATSLVDGEIDVEPVTLGGDDDMQLDEDAGSESEMDPTIVSVAELVPEDVDVAPVAAVEVVMVADEEAALDDTAEAPQAVVMAEAATAEITESSIVQENEG